MPLPYRKFGIWILSDLAVRERSADRITFRGNHVSDQRRLPRRSPEETAEQFAARTARFEKSLPRRSDFSERIALAMRAFMLDGEDSYPAAFRILENLRELPAKKRAEYEAAGIGWAFRAIDPPIGLTRRNHRRKRKKRGISSEERQVHSIRTQAYRFIRRHKDFETLFRQKMGSFREQFCRDEEWYASAEKANAARIEAFEKLPEPFDWYAAMPLAGAAQVYHEQRKFVPALSHYRKAIGAARRAVMHEGFRAFVIRWLRLEVKLCQQSAGMLRIPAYEGPWLP
jgi:hypothetical protein